MIYFAQATAIIESRALMATLMAASSRLDGEWKQYPLNVRDPLSRSEMSSFWTAYARPSLVTHVERFIGRSYTMSVVIAATHHPSEYTSVALSCTVQTYRGCWYGLTFFLHPRHPIEQFRRRLASSRVRRPPNALYCRGFDCGYHQFILQR